MSIKVKQGLIECFKKIESKTFDETTIRLLLIFCREHLPGDSLMKELAHFIAHPDRNQGMFHKKINNRYAKWKLAKDQVRKLDEDKTLIEKLKTEGDVSDLVLGGVNVERIDAKLFEIIYFDGIEDISVAHLKKYTGYSKPEAIKKLNRYYTKVGKEYVLNRAAIHDELKATMFKRYNIAQFGSEIVNEVNQSLETSDEAKKYVEHVVRDLDRLQQVIRGTIEFQSVFRPIDLFNQLVSGVQVVIKQFDLTTSYLGSVRKYRDEIMLCIMTLLHDAKFYFYDKSIASVFLCVYLDPPSKFTKDEFEKRSMSSYAYENAVIALYLIYDVGGQEMKAPLFVSDLRVKNYIPEEKFLTFYVSESTMMKEIPWITAKRTGTSLSLSD